MTVANSLQHTVRAALEVAQERAGQLREIRAALLAGDAQRAIGLMKVYVGIEDADESDLADSSLH